MNIRTKKKNRDGIVRVETSGKIKEVFVNEDFLKPNDAKVTICFRGKDSSGIVELSSREIGSLYKSVYPKLTFLEDTKIIKFKK